MGYLLPMDHNCLTSKIAVSCTFCLLLSLFHPRLRYKNRNSQEGVSWMR